MTQRTIFAEKDIPKTTIGINTEGSLAAFIISAECEFLKCAIMRAGGNNRKAALAAGVSYPTFMRKIKAHQIEVRATAFEVITHG